VARQKAPRRGVIFTGMVLCVALAAAVGGVFGGPLLARQALGAGPRWHAGSTPSAPPPVLTAADGRAQAPTPDGVTAALRPLIAAAGLGTSTGISVIDLSTGQQLYGLVPDGAMIPASVTKLVTATTVLATRGPAYRIATRAVAGPNPGDVVLVGGGDPTLSIGAGGTYPGAARLDDLAAQVRKALGGTAPTRVIYDGSLFTGDLTGPGWDPDSATGGFGSVITALMTDGARINPKPGTPGTPRYAQPDVAAAQAFARQLGLPATAVAAGTQSVGAKELGKVESAPLMRMVEVMLAESDNVIAELLARQVALARGQPASFTAATATMRTVLQELGLPVAGYGLVDGSGLSRLGRLSPSILTAVLALDARADKPDLHGVFTGLPVAGYSGTLSSRFRKPEAGGSAAGEIRAKTGRLTGVSSIAGVVVDADGRTLAFAMIADANRSTPAAVEALDRIAAALAACGCR
jgi:D-alanyl-D-alanine carboxypeptidase/D-alanyl-D-alanine-endopeptidase (penicillin-binding protein 4)